MLEELWFPPAIFNLPDIAPVILPEAVRPRWLFWIFMGPCAVGWLVAYGLAIRLAARHQRVGVPLWIIPVNLAWESTLSLVLDQADVQRPINFAWFLFNTMIVYTAMKYGRNDYPGMSKKLFLLTFWGIYTWSGFFHVMAGYEFKDSTGIYTGTGLNVVLSLGFIFMLKLRGSSIGQSMYIAIAKGIGSFFAGWTVIVMYPGHNLFFLLYLTVWATDVVYCVMVYRKCREEGRPPWQWSWTGFDVPKQRKNEKDEPEAKIPATTAAE